MQRLAASSTLGRLRLGVPGPFIGVGAYAFSIHTPTPSLMMPSEARRFASHGSGGHGHDDLRPPGEEKIPIQSEDYRPGSDTFAYENPYPKLNGGRLDWLFGEGWRRPLANDQGGKPRREWIWFGQHAYDEHKDWLKYHGFTFLTLTLLTVWLTVWLCILKSDEPLGRGWALREAHLEYARRSKRPDLSLVSMDLLPRERVEITLPSEEELRDFEIII